jgi:alanine-glyoxylate transaminase / serine-glyoxylate transaminase / serine-pyruvate transaminase
MNHRSGRHFLQIPGPSNVPDRVLRALAAPTIDHRGPEFARLAREVLGGVARLAGTAGPVALYPSSGTGAWEAALVNTLSPGDKVLAFETGHFAVLWAAMAERLGLDVDLVPGDWRSGVRPEQVFERLSADSGHTIKAVTVVHNETSTGVESSIPGIRAAIDAAGHPALLIVDAISSLGSIDYRHDEWGADVTVWCSQKGMMLPPGLGLNAVSAKALGGLTSRMTRPRPPAERDAGGREDTGGYGRRLANRYQRKITRPISSQGIWNPQPHGHIPTWSGKANSGPASACPTMIATIATNARNTIRGSGP